MQWHMHLYFLRFLCFEDWTAITMIHYYLLTTWNHAVLMNCHSWHPKNHELQQTAATLQETLWDLIQNTVPGGEDRI